MSVRLVIQLLDGDEVIHEFNRATTNVLRGIPSMLEAGMGWMQAYSAVVTPAQWAADVQRVRVAKDVQTEHLKVLAPDATKDVPG